jgi:hypothetical protein
VLVWCPPFLERDIGEAVKPHYYWLLPGRRQL